MIEPSLDCERICRASEAFCAPIAAFTVSEPQQIFACLCKLLVDPSYPKTDGHFFYKLMKSNETHGSNIRPCIRLLEQRYTLPCSTYSRWTPGTPGGLQVLQVDCVDSRWTPPGIDLKSQYHY
jgi:hypothetical protein